MNWRRLLLWIALIAVLAAAVLAFTRVAKMAFAPRQVSQSVLLESPA
ncbi:MAG TPA: hypothetical protein VLI21_14790 [Casimicrobiaceae bacterium]|nr:hypothetical protein [Casimicrobiaceae bacterium]